MTLTNTTTRYGLVTKGFHWLTAFLIILLIPLGAIAVRLPYETSEQLAFKATLFSWHKTLGVLVFVVALGRIIWALTQTKPGPLHPDRKAETTLAETVHWLLYGSLVVVPLSGWIHHAATSGFAPIWWPLGQGLPLVPKSEAVAAWFGILHFIVTKVLIAALLLHVAGALKHHVIDKDATLRRMWFGHTAVPDVGPHRSPLVAPLAAVLVFLGTGALATVLASDHTPAAPSAAPLDAVASDWTVEDGSLTITVRQFGNDVTGTFTDWTAAIRFDENAGPDFGDVAVTIAIGSLTLGSVTDQAMGADFFDAATFPTATFTGPIVADGDGYAIDGILTLKGAEVPLELPFALTLDGDRATATGRTTIDRRDARIGEGQSDETNVGFDVIIDVSLTAAR